MIGWIAPIELMKKNSVQNCNSNNNVPVRCNNRSQWRKQTKIFHPDRNGKCADEALAKWELFDSDDSCNRFGMGKKIKNGVSTSQFGGSK